MARFGVMVPWANLAVEEELPAMLGPQHATHVARLVPASLGTALTDEFLDGLVAAVPGALQQLSQLRLDAIAFACTSAEFGRLADHASCLIVTAYDAIRAALDRRGIRKVHLVAAYPADVCNAEAFALKRDGFDVVSVVGLDQWEGYEQIESKTLLAAALQGSERADAVVLSCTGLRTRRVLADLKASGVVAMSSNSALAEQLTYVAGRRDAAAS